MTKKAGTASLVFFIVFLTILGQAGIDLYLPSMPVMKASLHMSETLIQWTISTYLVGYGISQLFYGPLSDYFGRKPILFFGLSLYFFASIGCCFSYTAAMIIVFRLIEGLGSGSASVLSRAVMRDSFSGNMLAKSSSYMAIAWSLVPILAPVFGGFFQSRIGWQANFAFLSVLCFIALMFGIYKLPETCQNIKSDKLSLGSVLKGYYTVLSSFTYVSSMIILVLLFCIFTIFNVTSPFIYETFFRLTPVQYSFVLFASSMGYLIGSFINSRLLKYLSKQKLIMIGMIIIVISSIVMLSLNIVGTHQVITILIPMLCILLGLGFIFANCLSICLEPFPKIAGISSAMYGFLVFAGSGIISAIYSKMTSVNFITFSTAIFIFSFIMLSTFIIILFKNKLQASAK